MSDRLPAYKATERIKTGGCSCFKDVNFTMSLQCGQISNPNSGSLGELLSAACFEARVSQREAITGHACSESRTYLGRYLGSVSLTGLLLDSYWTPTRLPRYVQYIRRPGTWRGSASRWRGLSAVGPFKRRFVWERRSVTVRGW